ncbi:MAG: sulfurtransferase TusA family protein [Desulfobulbaceae bacterium]|nr:sulfurtransferase TusA family protein [Desulfobulbaceae bacterium]
MTGESCPPDVQKNLIGIGCPMNMVYAKVELAKLREGQVLELILDAGAPVINVSRSIGREGHTLLKKIQLQDKSWSLLIRKGR